VTVSGNVRIDSLSDALRVAHTLKQDLDSTYTRYRAALTDVPLDFQGDAHKYMCVRLAGFLEQLLHGSFTGYFKSSVDGMSSQFAMSHFKYAPNLRPESVTTLFARFGDPWASKMEEFLDQNDRRTQLGNLLKVRNMTAHGQSYQGALSNVHTYKELVDDFFNWTVKHVLSYTPTSI